MKRKFKRKMANNSTNINKMKTTSCLKSFNTKTNRPQFMLMEFQMLALDRHKKVVVKQGSQHSPS